MILALNKTFVLICLLMAACCVAAESAEKLSLASNERLIETKSSFAGYSAVLLKSDIQWNAWDSTMYGTLTRRGMEVVWEEESIIDTPASLAQYDMIAMNIRHKFTPAQIEGLKSFLASGGGIYITTSPCWGGNDLINEDFLRLCGAESYSFLKIKELTLMDSPLTEGFGQTKLLLPIWVGHTWNTEGIDVMSFVVKDGNSVIRDNEGKSLGILKEHGQGRTAMLSVSPENYKFCFPDSEVLMADRIFDNTLRWLMPGGHKENLRPNVIQVNLPRRAEVVSVFLDNKPVKEPVVRCVGSLQTVSVPVASVKPGKTATVKITYKPLSKARNIETWVHHPGGEFCSVFKTPSEAVDFLVRLNVTHVLPGLRSAGGITFYRGIPGDVTYNKIKEYSGDYLSEYIAECHRRGISVIGGFYMSNRAVLDKYPEAAWIGKDGKPADDPWVCLNNPKGQEHNIEAFRQLVEDYQLDGIMLDDNYQMIDRPCYCDYCKNDFKTYCQLQGITYKDTSSFTDDDAKLKAVWEQYMIAGTNIFCNKLKAICAGRGIPLGGWVNGVMSSTVHNAERFDFLGGMIYEVPAYAARGPVSILGERKFVNLLWAMNRLPEAMEAEVAEAVCSGNQAVGFWMQFYGRDDRKENWGLYTGKGGSVKNQNWFVEPGGLDSIARAFDRTEEMWLSWYKENIITGDRRFTVRSGVLQSDKLTIKIRNCGKIAAKKSNGAVDIKFLK